MASSNPIFRVFVSVPRPLSASIPIGKGGRSLHSTPSRNRLLSTFRSLNNKRTRSLLLKPAQSSSLQAKLYSTGSTDDGNSLSKFENRPDAPISFASGVFKVGAVAIPSIWLRDNCQCSACFHGETRQRLLDTFTIPRDVTIAAATTEGEYSSVTWSDGHVSRYPNDTLRGAVRSFESRAKVRQGLTESKLWGAEIKDNRPVVELVGPGAVQGNLDDKTVKAILETIRKYGFCLVEGIYHAKPRFTEKLLQNISFIRETHYGSFYDFTSDMASKDTAYTNIALEAHTDTTYFSDPAGLQAFHVLSHKDGEGGASLLVDGFKVAADLKAQDEEAYRILSTVNVHAHASGNAGISIQPYRGFPVLQHDPTTGHLLQVRWNSSDRAGIELPVGETPMWYEAARKFDALLQKEENEYWEKLEAGTVLIFDNWRVLHGRSAFTGLRRVCGGYVNRDDWISRYKMLVDAEKTLKQLPAS